MDKQVARKLADILLGSASGPLAEFTVTPTHKRGRLAGFHKWVDGKPHLGSFRVDRRDGPARTITLVQFRATKPDFYLVVFPATPSNPYAEIWQTVSSRDGASTLSWTYSPSKQDGRNAQRISYFEQFAGSKELRIALPKAQQEIPRFFRDIFDLVDMRLRADELNPEKPSPRVEFPEGGAVERLHKVRERSSALVEQVKREARQKGVLSCAVCSFDFETTYGALGSGYIEAHHICPLAELSSAKASRPEDLILVCANCHRMLHRRRPWLGRDEVHRILKKRRRRLP